MEFISHKTSMNRDSPEILSPLCKTISIEVGLEYSCSTLTYVKTLKPLKMQKHTSISFFPSLSNSSYGAFPYTKDKVKN